MSELQPITGGMSPEQFRARMLKGLPDTIRDEAAQDLEQWDALTPEERAEAYREDRLRFAKELSANHDFRRERCGLELKQWSNTFSTFYAASQQQREAKAAAQEFVKSWPAVQHGLMLWGPPGRGKDHLLHAITIALLQREDTKPDIRYWYSLDIERAMIEEWQRDPATRDSDDTRTEEIMRECDLLLIGDLHRALHVKSPQIQNAMLRTINQAETTGKPILCCTGNYPVSKYDEAFGDALGSRLEAIMQWLRVDGPEDYRRKAKR